MPANQTASLEVGKVSEPIAQPLNQLQFIVDSFNDTVASAMTKVVCNPSNQLVKVCVLFGKDGSADIIHSASCSIPSFQSVVVSKICLNASFCSCICANSVNALKAFAKSQRKIEMILRNTQEGIKRHHDKHQIDPERHNLKHRGKHKIEEIIRL